MADNTADLLKQVSAELKQATSDFSKQAENALAEAKKAGSLSEETKNAVDELATKFNSLTEAEKQLKAQLGELEQEFARLRLAPRRLVTAPVAWSSRARG